jgi:hypothetical protein
MDGDVFITQGDITEFDAHAVVYSASRSLRWEGQLYSSFSRRFPDFVDSFNRLSASISVPLSTGDSYWLERPPGRRPQGIVVVASTGQPREEAAAEAVRNAVITAHQGFERLAIPGRRLGGRSSQ